MSRVTMKDVARKSGWSLGTVSRVFSGAPGVCEKAREDVLQCAAALGYQKNEHAGWLALKHPDGIVLLVRAAACPYYGRLARNLAARLQKEGRRVRLIFLNDAEDEGEKALALMHQKAPSLFLFFGARRQSLRKSLGRISVPAISVGAPVQDLSFSHLSGYSLPESEMMQQAAEWLFELKKKNIGLILAPRLLSSEMEDRYLGVQYAFYSRNQTFSPANVQEAEASAQGGYDALCALYKKNPDLDGLVVACDAQIAGVLRAAADLGLSLPEDMALVCIDENGQGKWSVPRLSAFERDLSADEKAIENLVQSALASPLSWSQSRHEEAGYAMVWRESCPKPELV